MSDSLTRVADGELLRRCRREPDAFCVLYDRHARDLLRWVAAWCGDDQVALDVTQETFARALRDAHRFRPPADGSALPWLHAIARNLVRDWQRRGVVADRVRRELGIAADATAGAVDDEAPHTWAETRAALDTLPATQRRAVGARVLLGASYEEIASVDGITPTAARARVSRGLRTLRALLGPERGGG